jgi:GT2 family glycosyltransferase
MKLSIVIVSYNTKEMTGRAINSLPLRSDIEILVIDNASTDGTSEMIRKRFPEIDLIVNDKNLGFAKAVNQGIKKSRGEFVMLLNSDTQAKDNAIDELMDFMKSNPSIGVASCQLLNPDGSIQPQGGYLPRLSNIAFWMLFIDDIPIIGKNLFPYQLRNRNTFLKERKMGWVGGTAMLIKRQVIEDIGYFDENLFMYGEDVEFCYRANNKGIKISVTPKAKIVHHGQQSSQGKSSAAILGEFKALKYIFKKHKPVWEYPILRLLLKIGALLRMFIFGILQGKETYAIYKKAFQMA